MRNKSIFTFVLIEYVMLIEGASNNRDVLR